MKNNLIISSSKQINKNSLSGTKNLIFTIEENSELIFNFKVNKSAKINLEFNLIGKNSKVIANGIYLLKKHYEFILNIKVNHQSSNTISDINTKGALFDYANFNYQITTKVEKNSNNSKVDQENKTILFSEKANVISRPNLEILNKNSISNHNSAIGKFSVDEIYYLENRGLSYKKAQKILLNSFFGF